MVREDCHSRRTLFGSSIAFFFNHWHPSILETINLNHSFSDMILMVALLSLFFFHVLRSKIIWRELGNEGLGIDHWILYTARVDLIFARDSREDDRTRGVDGPYIAFAGSLGLYDTKLLRRTCSPLPAVASLFLSLLCIRS